MEREDVGKEMGKKGRKLGDKREKEEIMRRK